MMHLTTKLPFLLNPTIFVLSRVKALTQDIQLILDAVQGSEVVDQISPNFWKKWPKIPKYLHQSII